MQSDSPYARLEDAIKERLQRQHLLTVSLDKMRYAECVFLGNERFQHALYVGIGHGHDAALALSGGKVSYLDGVDPYYAAQGNDDKDYRDLLALIEQAGLIDRFVVHKMTIEEYLPVAGRSYDLIVLPDVLHHIFVTRECLSRSALYEPCVALFRSLRDAAADRCLLAISDAPRIGLRPWLVKRGVLKERVNYHTKQAASEWRRAAEEAGWSYDSSGPYVPYALRRLRPLLAVSPMPLFYSNRYFLRFRAE